LALLEVEGLRKSYHRRVVVDDVSYQVDTGEIVGLLGPNGAGKTTSFRMTIGMIPSDAGLVSFDGADVSELPMYKRAHRGMGYLSQEASVFQRMTVWNNVMAILETLRLPRAERRRRCERLLDRMGILPLARSMAYTLSGGERRRLEITRALVTNPRLLLLDEPFSGVDPKAVQEIQDIILELREDGIGILVTDHNVHHTLSVTDRSYLISAGRIEASGTHEELLANPRARELYFGDQLQVDHIARHQKSGARPKSAQAGQAPSGTGEGPASAKTERGASGRDS
jgi:lipopolysaccharide export system ATP-binding protein